MTFQRADYGPNPLAGANRNNAADRGWGSGWPQCPSSSKLKIVAKAGVRIPVRNELADLVATLLEATEEAGYDVKAGQTWCFACRPIRGTRTASNHSWALAVDINSVTNPMQSSFRSDIPPRVVHLWEACGFYWGGRYQNRPDAMHFEYVFRPKDVAAHLVRARGFLRDAPNPPKPPVPPVPPGQTVPPVPPVDPTKPVDPPKPDAGDPRYGKPSNAPLGDRILDRWDRGTDVELLQRWLRIKVDGYYGADTIAAVKKYQKTLHLPVDGVAGPLTLAPILRDMGMAK